MDALKYSDDVRALAREFIILTREHVQLPADAERGVRYDYNDGVLWRLEGMFTEDEFLNDAVHAVEMALIDAAKSDYWYSHEKEYEWPDDEEYEFESDAC